ncbi:MAG: hypothetical protein R3F34_10700 [Planctomycetota bacterium]
MKSPVLAPLLVASFGAAGAFAQGTDAHQGPLQLSDEPAPLRTDLVPDRPRPILELGDPFLGTGPFGAPFVTATGAVWQPSLLVYGTLRTGFSRYDTPTTVRTELVSRLDLFGNLQLSGTERLLVGLRPLDQDGRFTRYVFSPDDAPDGDGFQDEFNAELTTLFFEGDFGELFPGLDRRDQRTYDVGFSVGRQPYSLQDGLLLDDRIDAIGITRNSLLPSGTSNLRVTGVLGVGDLHRGDNVEDDDALLLALSSEADLPYSTVGIDAVWVADTGGSDTDALFAGVGAVQRIGRVNTSFRAMTSQPLHGESSAAGRGGLLFAELSRELEHSHDQVYATAFAGLGDFTSAARGPENGGPLGRAGILFAAVGLGGYPAALGNDAKDALGGALGFQTYLGDERERRQLVLEVGGRAGTDGSAADAVALGSRYQVAFGRHGVVVVDGYLVGRHDIGPSAGLRFEVQFKF